MWIEKEEYNKIKKSFPIPCVDLIVMNPNNQILMLMRQNEPAKGQWWFPGGRVMFGESRKDAAIRKLKEECGIENNAPQEWKTFDIFLEDKEENYMSHGISSFFIFHVDSKSIMLDNQSSQYEWNGKLEWLNKLNNTFIKNIIDNIPGT